MAKDLSRGKWITREDQIYMRKMGILWRDMPYSVEEIEAHELDKRLTRCFGYGFAKGAKRNEQKNK